MALYYNMVKIILSKSNLFVFNLKKLHCIVSFTSLLLMKICYEELVCSLFS